MPEAPAPKGIGLSAAVHAYLVGHGTPPDGLQQRLIEETRALGGISMMQIAPEQGAFMTLLTRLMGAKRAVEIGTFTGYSALCIAQGLPEDGALLCLDTSEEWTQIARRYWREAGLEDRIELRIGPAQESLLALPEAEQFDLAFVDADKSGYIGYLEALLPRLRPGGLILVDNVLWLGRVADESAQDENTRAIRDFNARAAADPRVECVMLPIADGLTLLRKR